jgi:hypothetical protein
MPTHQPPTPPVVLDLAAILERSEQAYAAARSLVDTAGRAGLALPGAIREHFNYDVPALIGALQRRADEPPVYHRGGLISGSDQVITDTAPYATEVDRG